ncbi:MAG: hypothetical protein JSV32_01965, partial [Dehalococcoidia bacterium]
MSKTVMIVGLGDLGGWVLEFLARTPGVYRIVTTDIREEWGRAKTMTAAVGSSQQGYNKRLEFHKLDVTDVDRTAELLNKFQPDVVYSATTLQSWWVPYLLPTDIAKKAKRAGVGPLVAGHLPLINKLMLAIKKSGIKTKVLNNSFPDLINPVLWRNGLGPDIGSGNSDMIMEDIRQKLSYELNVPTPEIAVYLYTAHATCMQANERDIPFLLKLYVAGKDVTANYDAKKLVASFASLYMPAKMTTWLAHPRVAASAVKNIMAIINNTNELTHVPGPSGLPGGYTVRVNAKGAEVALPEGINLEQAIQVNLDALKFDGIQEIKEDGTIVFTEECR